MDEVVVEQLTPEKFLIYWPMIEKELDTVPHIWHDFWTKEALRDWTVEQRIQCWGVGYKDQVRVICWSQVIHYPVGNVLQVFLAIGNGVDSFLETFDSMSEKFARDTNCVTIDVSGRPGWARKLTKYGFRHGATVMTKRVDHRRLQ